MGSIDREKKMPFESLYVPIIKTTDAELRGYEELSGSVKDRVFPVFELTKSRNTSRVPEGDIARRMSRIEEVVGERPFILDITTHESLINSQIESLLVEDDGFSNWYNFLCQYDHMQICPVVHAYEDEDLRYVVDSARNLQRKFGQVAFRTASSDANSVRYLQAIYDGIRNTENVFLVLDCGYIGHTEAELRDGKNEAVARLNEVAALAPPGGVTVASSSFPSSVVQHPHGEDHYGELPMEEVALHRAVAAESAVPLTYGDFASIHPFRYQVRGGTWVPRIDVSLDETYLYTRYRREDGGYIRAAKAMLETDWYESVDCWGDNQIQQAAAGEPNGLSPSFWIAVRLNTHITRKSSGAPP
ncbi:MAG: beta family protein [Aquisalimonadaceae bacterium]